MLSYPGTTLKYKKRHDFWRIPHTKSKSTHFPHTTGEDTKKTVHFDRFSAQIDSKRPGMGGPFCRGRRPQKTNCKGVRPV